MERGNIEYVDDDSLDDFLRVWRNQIVYGPVVTVFEQLVDYKGRTLLSASQWMVIIDKEKRDVVEEIVVGSVVVHNSKPDMKMTVASIATAMCYCRWFEGPTLNSATFPINELRLA